MASDYRAIHQENRRRYGSEVGEYGRKFLPHRYGDRTHFLRELLHNAEDALARRKDWQGSRSVRFDISPEVLRVRHYGSPFDADDVRARRAGSVPARRRLVHGFGRLRFVPAVEARDGARRFARPGAVAVATASQQELFADPAALRFVDDGVPGLDYGGARSLVRESCAVRARPEPFAEVPALGPEERTDLRSREPRADSEGGIVCIEDRNQRGPDPLLAAVGRMPATEQQRRRELLPPELEALPEIHDLAVRSGKYECNGLDGSALPVQVPAAWMRRLTRSSWAPEATPLVRIGPADAPPSEPARPPASQAPRPPRSSAKPRVAALPLSDGETSESAPPGSDDAEKERWRGVEEQAIRLILEGENDNRLRAEPCNPGFDLYRRDAGGDTTLRCEIKAPSGRLHEFPARLTPSELRCAHEHGDRHWLYIVGNLAGDNPQNHRIPNPAGAAERFTVGPEWRERVQPPP